ncbi:MAG: amidohydrolase family protein [Salibacteraceae bacterium]
MKKVDHHDLIEVSDMPDRYVLSNANVFSGRDSLWFYHHDIIVENGMIRDVKPHDSILIEDYKSIDVTNKFVIPGLIDANVYLLVSGAVPWEKRKASIDVNLQAYLYMGITTVYDMGGDADRLEQISQSIEQGERIGPRIYHGHYPVSITESHPFPMARLYVPKWFQRSFEKKYPVMKSEKDALDIAKGFLDLKVDYMTVVCDELPSHTPSMPASFLTALTKTSHDRIMKVFAHVGSAQNAMTALNAGVDVLVQGIVRDSLTDEQIDAIIAAEVPIIWTLAPVINRYLAMNDEYVPSFTDRVLIPEEIIAPMEHGFLENSKSYDVLKAYLADIKTGKKHWISNLKRFYQRGGEVLIGSGSNALGAYAGATYLQELKLLQEMGISTKELLLAATSGNTRLINGNTPYGFLIPHRVAEMVVLNSDPMVDISAIDDQAFLIKGKQRIDRKM